MRRRWKRARHAPVSRLPTTHWPPARLPAGRQGFTPNPPPAYGVMDNLDAHVSSRE